jgi:uncharacterized protein YbjT (DUF2867 family)
MKSCLVAGATGYLGGFIARELKSLNYTTRVLVRNPDKFQKTGILADEIYQAEITDRSTLDDCCNNIDTLISTVGITRQKDGLSYMDVDYQANMNLLEEAKASGVRKFIYVSVLNGKKLKHLKICQAKEKFVEALKKSGMEYCVIRPNGFFSDMSDFYQMAKKGRVYLFGDGMLKANPIHGKDLAQVCVSAVNKNLTEIPVGGPQVFTQNEIATMAFEALRNPVKITHLPDWTRKLSLKLASIFMSGSNYGPIEFFLNVMAIDMVAPKYGSCTLKEHFDAIE